MIDPRAGPTDPMHDASVSNEKRKKKDTKDKKDPKDKKGEVRREQ